MCNNNSIGCTFAHMNNIAVSTVHLINPLVHLNTSSIYNNEGNSLQICSVRNMFDSIYITDSISLNWSLYRYNKAFAVYDLQVIMFFELSPITFIILFVLQVNIMNIMNILNILKSGHWHEKWSWTTLDIRRSLTSSMSNTKSYLY